MDRAWGLLGAVLVIALAMAGCTAPQAAAPSESIATAPATAATANGGGELADTALLAGEGDSDRPTCPLQTERTERAEFRRFVIEFQGCIAATDPVLLGGLPEDARADLEVHPGATNLRLQFHLDGAEGARMTLRDPAGAIAASGKDRGDKDRDTFFVAEIAEPAPGAWKFRAALDDLSVARWWEVVAIVSYEA
jgi:hypothetical protein